MNVHRFKRRVDVGWIEENRRIGWKRRGEERREERLDMAGSWRFEGKRIEGLTKGEGKDQGKRR